MSSQRQPEVAVDMVRQADIVLVEDDQRLAELTTAYLQQNGFLVSIEQHVDRVFDHFQRLQVKLVILDLMLPGLGGMEVCISRLRCKLGDDPQHPYRIKTVWGKGYLLAPDVWRNSAPVM